ncbi:hypothetical protein AB1Y20_008580 [Prymnesium parvum]|uniref:Uncharacterized protein n=1 Tax=Prymnesium parvum TaxID=97485 RepID=A0AB34ITN1_PRYPA
MATQDGPAVAAIKRELRAQGVEKPSVHIRYSTIACGCRAKLKNAELWQPLLADISERSGLYETVVSALVSNFMSRHPETITRDWKHFVDQGWTAIERRTAQKEDAAHPNALLTPKEFALFPSCKTKRRLVSYTWSQLKELLLFPLRRAVEVAADKKSALVQELKQQMQELHDASQEEQMRQMDAFFDWRKIKGKWKKRDDWHVCSFATDGIKLCITFATGRAPAVTNVPRLVKAGYQIPTPGERVDALQIERGLYHVREDNMHAVLKEVSADAKIPHVWLECTLYRAQVGCRHHIPPVV